MRLKTDVLSNAGDRDWANACCGRHRHGHNQHPEQHGRRGAMLYPGPCSRRLLCAAFSLHAAHLCDHDLQWSRLAPVLQRVHEVLPSILHAVSILLLHSCRSRRCCCGSCGGCQLRLLHRRRRRRRPLIFLLPLRHQHLRLLVLLQRLLALKRALPLQRVLLRLLRLHLLVQHVLLLQEVLLLLLQKVLLLLPQEVLLPLVLLLLVQRQGAPSCSQRRLLVKRRRQRDSGHPAAGVARAQGAAVGVLQPRSVASRVQQVRVVLCGGGAARAAAGCAPPLGAGKRACEEGGRRRGLGGRALLSIVTVASSTSRPRCRVWQAGQS